MGRTRACLSALVAVAAVTLAGCGGSDDDGEAPPTAPGVDLRTEILTVEDLPSGWAVDDSEDDDDSFSCFDEVQDFDDIAEASVDVAFKRGATDFLIEGIAYSDDPGVIENAYDDITQIFTGCGDIDEDGFTGTVAASSFKSYGDRSQAYTFDIETEGVSVQFVFLMVQVGDRFVLVAMGDLGEVDLDELEQVADTALAKVKRTPA